MFFAQQATIFFAPDFCAFFLRLPASAEYVVLRCIPSPPLPCMVMLRLELPLIFLHRSHASDSPYTFFAAIPVDFRDRSSFDFFFSSTPFRSSPRFNWFRSISPCNASHPLSRSTNFFHSIPSRIFGFSS